MFRNTEISRVQQLAVGLTATGTHMHYGITQCYLPPGRGDIPAFTTAKLVLTLATPDEM